ncbi:sigma-54 dependent transcriptional regulator [Moritella sp. F3]|uniref:sigma-54-dependent transcriptional regulator n=1 Tax=Moritella sp. F3 TaxID=2718882 RepID=UPI0018E1C216|nr:sigma-54 dependent transcriptional regulator [Moritella sp. F3]GIC75698.1 sigma-54-dependent Fis family transcriptional regulator [Moritella sp. F1]GIC81854.1 sigma-54-dependent Fis family transcriptional regulator [Moritella sp. F3]
MEFTALLVEDSASMGAIYSAYLRNEGANVTYVQSGKDALVELTRWQPDLLILDIQLPDMSGMDILMTVQQRYPDISIIMITAHASIDLAVDAMRAGAFDFLVKPFDAKRLSITLRNALKQRQLINLVANYESSLPKPNFHGFIGDSLAMQAVYKTIGCVASSKASVFIIGESGTGKEVCAQAVHDCGVRKNKPFVALNCAAIPKELIESEIFGHVKGAFTGATSNRDGAATRAHGGTLFLDEICEMDLDLQSKLLRFIQTGVFQRVGGSQEECVDVRFISATNRHPWNEVTAGRFREDLFYRLHVIPIELPPLRMRNNDSFLIAQQLLIDYSKEERKSFTGFDNKTIEIITHYAWPGNVRMLQNVIRQMVVLNEGELITSHMLPIEIQQANMVVTKKLTPNLLAQDDDLNMHNSSPMLPRLFPDDINTEKGFVGCIDDGIVGDGLVGQGITREGLMAEGIVPLWKSEKRIIENAISHCNGNIPKAAALLDISASTIYRKRQGWAHASSSNVN